MAVVFPPNSPMKSVEFFGSKNDEDGQEFSRPTPAITYTSDGRKLLNGVILSADDPEQLWNKVVEQKLTIQAFVSPCEQDATDRQNRT